VFQECIAQLAEPPGMKMEGGSHLLVEELQMFHVVDDLHYVQKTFTQCKNSLII